MTLLDLYEPLFQYICVLNRMSRKGAAESVEYGVVRAKVTSLLESAKTEARADLLLTTQVGKLELPVVFFVDSMIAESNLQCAGQWHRNRLAFASNQLAGDEKFFDLLEETLADSSKEATDRLTIYYVCLGLGFAGWYSGQPEYLRKKMEVIAKRISGAMDRDRVTRICPEAYQHLDARNLIEPPSATIGFIILTFLVLCILVVVVNYYFFQLGTNGFAQSLREIMRHDLAK